MDGGFSSSSSMHAPSLIPTRVLYIHITRYGTYAFESFNFFRIRAIRSDITTLKPPSTVCGTLLACDAAVGAETR